MATATATTVLADFQVESLGVEWPDYFQGYGCAFSGFRYCAYGIGDTEEEALADCLEMMAQSAGFDWDEATEKRIRAAYGPADDSETALEALGVEEETDESPYFHVGIKWNESN
jgi:hypothetical protein